jgi:hypothetical protein
MTSYGHTPRTGVKERAKESGKSQSKLRTAETKQRDRTRQPHAAQRVHSASTVKGSPEAARNGKQDGPEATAGILTILDTRKPDVVWSHVEFGRELEKATRIGPQNISNDHLISFCVGFKAYYHGRLLIDARPFFSELWRRIDKGELHMSKTAACRQIGCTRQWANAIVSGRADERREVRTKAKRAKCGNSVSAMDASTVLPTDEEYIDEILQIAFEKLKPLLASHWARYSTICKKLAEQFDEASKTAPVEKVRAAGAD